MTPLPYGRWPSPISPSTLTQGTVKLVNVWVDESTGRPVTVWCEVRPAEQGRQVLVVDDDGTPRDLIDAPFNARSAAHVYGGGEAWVAAGMAWFVNFADQRIYRVPLDGSTPPEALTSAPTIARSVRYADMKLSPDGTTLVAVRERDRDGEVVNDLVILDAHQPSEPRSIFSGTDFVMSPTFVTPDRIRAVVWNHPNMPWNSTSLIECDLGAGTDVVMAEGPSFVQPIGTTVISDQSGWWNLWRIDGDQTHLWPSETEIGGPAWVFGLRDHGISPDGQHVWSSRGQLVIDGIAHEVGAAGLGQLWVGSTTVTAIVSSSTELPKIVSYRLDDPSDQRVIVAAPPLPIPTEDISVAERIDYPTGDGAATAYGWFYPPRSSTAEGPADERPPLVTMIHGGPTSAARPFLSLEVQYWTTRGFAVVDVDHRGSTGMGTAYRNLLDDQWGVIDVEDCLAAATWLADQGWVDRDRMVIRGGSAGGFTVFNALAHGDVFAAGASRYGVADLSAFATDTHKFESRYLDRLIGPWPEARNLYEERSPISHLDRLDCPVIVFQGLDDQAVPPNQSEMIVSALLDRGIECDYHAYEGEGHGFRRADTIEHMMTAELDFYLKVFDQGSARHD